MDRISRQIYHQKLGALKAGDTELKIKVDEGKDLMSILRTSDPLRYKKRAWI